ncbi:MAG: hypothetical protein BWY71_01284 [Planctomycetes bacterium ADurb.Bin412]|nr:MAG: hypothetical protein BWY71_01284 [Planctomycetes bacterium ADurb.Bin412]
MAGIGGYGETFLATAIIILLAWRLPDVSEGRRLFFACFVLGLVSGFSFYILFLVLPGILAFVLPAVWREPHKRWWRLASFCLGGLLGASPMIFYNLTSGGGTFLRAAGRSMAVGREAVQTPLAELMRQIFFNKLAYLKAWFLAATGMFGEYVMPEVMGDPILTVAGLLLVFALAWFVIHAIGSRLSPDRVASKRLGEFAVFIVFLMLFQWIGNLNRARHFMPLILALPVVLFAVNLRQGGGKRRAIALWLIVGAVSLLQAGAWLVKFQAAHFSPAPVAAAMRSAGITHFYGSYGTVYPIMFADNRNLRGSPKFVAGNKGILSDRRPDYTREVEQAMFPAFVFADNEKELRDRLLAFLEASGAEATVMTIDGTDVVFNLSVPIHAVFAPDRGTTFALGKHQ